MVQSNLFLKTELAAHPNLDKIHLSDLLLLLDHHLVVSLIKGERRRLEMTKMSRRHILNLLKNVFVGRT